MAGKCCARMLVMVQLEVADRLAAEPGGRVYGVPSVKARWYGEVRKAGGASESVQDMTSLYAAIPHDTMSVSQTMTGAVRPVLAGDIVLALLHRHAGLPGPHLPDGGAPIPMCGRSW